MLSVLIETGNHEEALARTLASLVSAAVEGMVREVIVLDRGSTDGTSRVADHAGCVFLAEASLSDVLQRARGDWLLLIEPGARLVDGWTDEVRRHVAVDGGAARFTPTRLPFWERLGLKRRGLSAGLLVSKQDAVSVMRKNWDGLALARTVRARRLDAGILAGD
ncbi:glycosyltransferase [Tianweitania sp.]|uniref:glycosyltransferase n=1 Tax=Tianweitania sp. TaxID=2021634 RepID=UPI00289E2134|nr:glycosyltransferase [Tianweitania sp.]